jgi:hypothetical protein
MKILNLKRWVLIGTTIPLVFAMKLTCPSVAQDVAKRAAEGPLENLIQSKPNTPLQGETPSQLAARRGLDRINKQPLADRSKHVAEGTTKAIVGLGNAAALLPASNTPSDDPFSPRQKSNKVQPGDVQWHTNLESASENSRKTGKPILHFQLLGQLDERFT